MEFENRQAQFPGNRKLTKVDENNVPISGEEPFIVRVEKADGTVTVPGTPITADKLNLGNWQDNDSVKFSVMQRTTPPDALDDKTQIVTLSNGEIWVIPPKGPGHAIEITESAGTAPDVDLDAIQQAIDSIPNTYIPLSQKGSINGVAEIDRTGLLPQGTNGLWIGDTRFAIAPQSAHIGGGKISYAPSSSLSYPFSGEVQTTPSVVFTGRPTSDVTKTVQIAMSTISGRMARRHAISALEWSEWVELGTEAGVAQYKTDSFPNLVMGSSTISEVLTKLGITTSDLGIYYAYNGSSGPDFYTYMIHVLPNKVIIERNSLTANTGIVEKSIGSFNSSKIFIGYSPIGG